MAELESSALMQEVALISAAPGSPYYQMRAVIHAGGKEIVPLQILRKDTERDYRQAIADNTAIVVAIGAGTLMNGVGPFQDDLKITLTIIDADEQGTEFSDKPILARTYCAYLGDEIARPSDSSYNPSLTDTETADRSSIKYVTFVLEEVAAAQLRKMRVGYIGRACPPYAVMQTLMVRACGALKLAADEAITGFDMTTPNNQTPRDHVIIEDNTDLFDVPDILQNDQGGIYSTGLGIYLQGAYIYAWPLYDCYRQASAKRLLQVLLAPNRHSVMVDKTWRQAGRATIIYSAGVSQVLDDSLGQLNTGGNAVRFTMANQLVDGEVDIADNKMVTHRGKTNSEFSTAVVGNGQNVANTSERRITGNTYHEASQMAKRAGAIMVVPWRRSNPELITPGMAVEIMYDFNGIIRTIEGTLLNCTSSYELEGQGMNAFRYTCASVLSIFVDRNDPDYIDYMKNGGQVSPTPEIGSL